MINQIIGNRYGFIDLILTDFHVVFIFLTKGHLTNFGSIIIHIGKNINDIMQLINAVL